VEDEKDVNAEQKRRMELLLNIAKPVALKSGETLRGVRAIGVLERIGTPEARRVLELFGSGAAADARLTREAKAALSRFASQ
jgi:hypothetical protein